MSYKIGDIVARKYSQANTARRRCGIITGIEEKKTEWGYVRKVYHIRWGNSSKTEETEEYRFQTFEEMKKSLDLEIGRLDRRKARMERKKEVYSEMEKIAKKVFKINL